MRSSRFFWPFAIASLIAEVAFGGPNGEAIDKAIDEADLIVVARPLRFDPPVPPQGEWRQIGMRVDALLDVTEILKGVLADSTIRVAHYRSADHDEIERPNLFGHAGHSLWFLIRRDRGVHGVVNQDMVLEDSTQLRLRIERRQRTARGLTPLFVANDADDVARSLQAGLDVDAQDANGDTALHWAIEHNRPVVARALLAANAATQLVNRDGQNVLDVAVHLQRRAIIAMLLDAGATAQGLFLLNKPLGNYDGYLALGADVNARASDGTTPIARRLANLIELPDGRVVSTLHETAVEEKLRWLLDRGANADGYRFPESLELRSGGPEGR